MFSAFLHLDGEYISLWLYVHGAHEVRRRHHGIGAISIGRYRMRSLYSILQ